MWPLSSSAQKPNIRRIGVLVVGNADADAVTFQAELREELRKSGYVEGQNLTFELRSARTKDRSPAHTRGRTGGPEG